VAEGQHAPLLAEARPKNRALNAGAFLSASIHSGYLALGFVRLEVWGLNAYAVISESRALTLSPLSV